MLLRTTNAGCVMACAFFLHDRGIATSLVKDPCDMVAGATIRFDDEQGTDLFCE